MNTLAFLLLSLLIQEPRLGSIDGIVVRAGTTQPVANAVVQLGGEIGSELSAVATTADGKFQFRKLRPGRYRLTVSHSGYMSGGYGQRGPNGTPSQLEISAGQTLKDIRLNLTPTGTMSGRVYASTGEPQANAPVFALRYQNIEGERKLSLVKSDITDDRGEYRLFWLPPGQYYISVSPEGTQTPGEFVATPGGIIRATLMRADSHDAAMAGGRSETAQLGEAEAPVFYPGTADTQAAQAIEVRPGADIGGLDVALSRVKTRKLRGTVIDATGQPATSAMVMLISRSPSAVDSMAGRPLQTGAFEFSNVLPGSYFLVATQRKNTPATGVVTTGGRIAVDVGASDLDQLAITLSPAINVPGNVTLEGRRGPDAQHPIVSLNSSVGIQGRQRSNFALFNGDSFSVEDVLEGDYRVEVIDVPKTAYIKSIRFGATDVLNDGLHVDTRSSDRLDVVLSFDAGGLDGTVAGRDGKPMSNTSVTLVPDAALRQREDLYKRVSTDESGRFHFDGIAPGQYSVFAWEDVDDNLWRDPDYLRRNGALGKIVAIREGSRENVELTAIPLVY